MINNNNQFYSCRRGEVTDEFLVETQPNHATVPPSQSIVMQPISNSSQIHKTKYYENDVSQLTHRHTSPLSIPLIKNSNFSTFFQFDNNLISSGKYRQRSYDNLKMGKCSSTQCTVPHKMHSSSNLSKYRLSTDLSKINNEEEPPSMTTTTTTMNNDNNHRRRRQRKPCAIPSERNSTTTTSMLLSSSHVKLTPQLPTQYKVYGPQRQHRLIHAYGDSSADHHRQNAQNNNHSIRDNDNNKRLKIDRWTAERLQLLRGYDGDTMSECANASDNDNGNHLIELNETFRRKRIT